MWHFLDSNAPAIQGIASIIALVVTAFLAFVTVWYARTAAQTLKLSREQFRREWEPRIHVHTSRVHTATVCQNISNLGRAAIVLTGVELEIQGKTVTEEIEFVLGAGGQIECDLTSEIIRCFNKCGFGPGAFSFDGEVGFSIRFESLGVEAYSKKTKRTVKVDSGRFLTFS